MTSSSLNDSKRWPGNFLIAGLICFFVGLNLAIPTLMSPRAEYMTGLVVGICVGEVNLIAAWAALATGNVLLRLPWSLLLGLLMWYSLILGSQLPGFRSFAPGDATLLGIVLLVGLVCAQIPLWIAGKAFRWKLVRGRTADDSRQFSLRHMLLGIFLFSVALGAGRMVLPDRITWVGYVDDGLWVLVAALILSNLAITLPCIWGSFARPRLLLPLSFAWLIYCALLTGIEFGCLCAILGSPGNDNVEVAFAFYLINVAQCGTVFGVLLLLRAVGFRFVRVPPRTGAQITE